MRKFRREIRFEVEGKRAQLTSELRNAKGRREAVDPPDFSVRWRGPV